MGKSVADLQNGSRAASPDFSDPPRQQHPEAKSIIEIFEEYLGDDHLPADAHLLALTGGDGSGPVKIHEMLVSYNKLRRFKDLPSVRQALKSALYLEVVDEDWVKRRYPLKGPFFVKPQINERKHKEAQLLETNPWLTKNMLKATGFETGNAPVSLDPKEYEKEHKFYDSGETFITRIETAINRFVARRKMHQQTLAIFEKFMSFGGISCGQHQFANSVNPKELAREGLTKDEIIEMTGHYVVLRQVCDGVEETRGENVTWVVDFEGLARGFLSSQFIAFFDWNDEGQLALATNILRNFYTYLIQYDVCPEYADQLTKAREVCDLAETELRKLSKFDKLLPGGFNAACSVLFKEKKNTHVAFSTGNDDSWKMADDSDLTTEDALLIFKAGMYAYGSEEQLSKLEKAAWAPEKSPCVSEEIFDLEIVSMELPSEDANAIYRAAEFIDTIVKPLGKVKCCMWDSPCADPTDFGDDYVKPNNIFEFLVEEETLAQCCVGMKLEVIVKQLDIGVAWLDSVLRVYPSFFTWLANEVIYDWKEPGPPKEWMQRQNQRKKTSVDVNQNVEGGGEEAVEDENAEQ